MAMAHPCRPLLIGIGNRLRGDDGAGYRLAEILRATPGATAVPLQVLAVHQLTPELAATIAAANAVLFADAWFTGSGKPEARPWPVLEPIPTHGDPRGNVQDRRSAPPPGPLSHQLSAAQLLELSHRLYGRRPPAWQLLLPVCQLQHGEDLSPASARAVAAALQLVRHWRPSHA